MKKHFVKFLTLSLVFVFVLSQVYCQSYQASRKYRVTAFKYGNNSITSLSNETEVIPSMYIYIPNSFTPNGDGLNDTFGISGQAINTFSMQIFNRWGEMVFETKNAGQTWDGTYHGEKVQQGVYVYKLTAASHTGRTSAKEGTVTVVL